MGVSGDVFEVGGFNGDGIGFGYYKFKYVGGGFDFVYFDDW